MPSLCAYNEIILTCFSDTSLCIYNATILTVAPIYVTVVPYEVTVTTGDVAEAGTDAKIFITVFGTKGSTAPIELEKNEDRFERARTDTIKVCTIFLLCQDFERPAKLNKFDFGMIGCVELCCKQWYDRVCGANYVTSSGMIGCVELSMLQAVV